MDYLFNLGDFYSDAVSTGYNHLIIVIGSNIMEAVWVIIINNLIIEMRLYRVHV